MRIAVSDGGNVYLASVSANPNPGPSAVKLLGNQRITLLRFVGDRRLVGAAGERVVSFDLAQVSRVGTVHTGSELPWPCNACPAMRLSMRPDGAAATVVGQRSTALILDLSTTVFDPIVINSGAPVVNYTEAIWTSDSSRLVLTADEGYDASDTEVLVVGEAVLRRWAERRVDRLGLARAPDGLIYDVGIRGEILVREAASGEVHLTIPGPGRSRTRRVRDRPADRLDRPRRRTGGICPGWPAQTRGPRHRRDAHGHRRSR